MVALSYKGTRVPRRFIAAAAGRTKRGFVIDVFHEKEEVVINHKSRQCAVANSSSGRQVKIDLAGGLIWQYNFFTEVKSGT